MEKIKSNLSRHYKTSMLFIALNLIFYGVFVIHHYAADTYLTEAFPWDVTTDHYFMNARWMMSCFAYFCDLFSVNHTIAQLLSWIVSILSISLSSVIVYNLLLKKCKKTQHTTFNIWGILASFMLISNVFMIEYFIFAEYSGVICFGILCNVIAASFILKCIEEKRALYYLVGLLFAILGINGHQGSFALFLVVCAIFSTTLFSSIKSFIQHNLIIGSAYLIPCLVAVLETRIGGAPRLAQSIDILASFQKSTYGILSLLRSTARFMPSYIYAVFIGLLGIYFLYQIVRVKSWKTLLFAAYCCLIALLGIYAPLLMTDINGIDVVPRTVYIMGSALPAMILLMLLHLLLTPKKNWLLSGIIALFLLVQYHGILTIATGTYQANAVDRYEAQYIRDFLNTYNNKNDVIVTKIVLYWDTNVSGYATGVIGYGAVNERILSNEWAAPLAIKCLTGYEISQSEPSDEVYRKYFKGKDWNQLQDEQFVIIGDTLHLCAY